MAGFAPLSGNVGAAGGLQLVNEVLTTVAKQFRPQGYIYDRLVAPQAVNYNVGFYPVFNPQQMFSSGGNLNVADRAPTPMVDFEWSTSPYQCKDYRLRTQITRKEMAQAHPALRLEYSKTVGLLTNFATNREARLATQLRATANGGAFTSNSGNAITPAVKWDQGTSATPATIQSDIQSAMLQVMKSSGIRPNTIVMDVQVALAIANDFTLKDLIKYQNGASIINDPIDAILPRKLFGLNVVIADGTLFNAGRPGDPSATLTGVWGNSVRIMYVNPAAQWGVPSTVYSFRGRVNEGVGSAQPPSAILPTGQGGQEPGPAGGWAVVDEWWEMDPPVRNIRCWECVDERVVAPELGIEIQNVLNSPVY